MQSPLPEPQVTSSSTQFTLTLPTTISPGLYNLAAIGTNASGLVQSAPMSIDVEWPYNVGSTTLVSLSITPATSTINSGHTFQFQATGNYSDGSTLNLTSAVTWSSSNTSLATIGTAGSASPGLAAAVQGIGTATITATFGSATASASLTITPPPS